MTKKLEELLNLPESKKIIKQEEKEAKKAEVAKPFLRDMSDFDKISAALPQVKGLGDASDAEFDALAQRATDAYDDLMDLGMNVEARYSGQILQTAGVLLGHAITAKQAKIDKKLRMVDLQLKKMRLDQSATKELSGSPVEGHAVVLDRNELLKQILADNKGLKKPE